MESTKMTISAAQCRAARALLDWSQDHLAKSAMVARATVADFERGLRLELMRQNMIAIVSTLEAAGVEFLPETREGNGAGVRLRKLELEYSKEPRAVEEGLQFQLRYRGTTYRLLVTWEALDDLGHLKGAQLGERVKVAEGRLGLIMRRAEQQLEAGRVEQGGLVLITSEEVS
jgi:transcriptional regulator with XRE-family HTH domain